VELQEPGPVYLPVSAGGFAAAAGFGHAKKIAPSKTTAHRIVNRLATGPIFIRSLGWNSTSLASEFFILPVRCEVNKRKRIDFLVSKLASAIVNQVSIKSPTPRITTAG
jgi:hypothetical protein